MIVVEMTPDRGLRHVHVKVAQTAAALKERTAAMLQNTERQLPDPTGGRQVVGLGLTPRSADGTRGGEVVKRIRTGPPVPATFAAPTPYFRLSDARRAELEGDAAALAAKIAQPGLDLVVKDKLKQDLKKITDELAMDRGAPPERSSSAPGHGYDRATT